MSRWALGALLVASTGCQWILGIEDTEQIAAGGPDASAATCGDGDTEAPETCDDGDTESGDGCSSVCLDETLFCEPTRVGELPLTNVGRIAFDADFLYVNTRFTSGAYPIFRVFDVSDPANIAARGTFQHVMADFPMNRRLGIAKSGDFVWVAGENPELVSLNVSDPDLPVIGFQSGPNENDGHIALVGNFLFVSDSVGERPVVYDISNPNMAVSVSALGDPGNVYYNVGAFEDTAYISTFSNRIDVVNIADPTASAVQGMYLHAASWTSSSAVQRIVANDSTLAFAVQGAVAVRGVHLVDTTLRSAPSFAATIDVVANDLALVGDFLYVPFVDGLRVYDISDPEAPELAGAYVELAVESESVAIGTNRAYLGTGDGLRIIDGLPGICDAVCGNSHVEYPEGCDDGNRSDGDDCSASCE